MKSVEQILEEAPVSRSLEARLGLVCPVCPWWTNDWAKATEGEQGTLLCGACGAPLKELPLEVLIEGTRESNPEHFDGFLKAFSDNWEAPDGYNE